MEASEFLLPMDNFASPPLLAKLRLWWCEWVNHMYSTHSSKFTVWQSNCSIHVILLFKRSAIILWRSIVSGCRYVLGMFVRFANLCHCAIMLKMDWVNDSSCMILPALSDRLHTFQFHCFRTIFLLNLVSSRFLYEELMLHFYLLAWHVKWRSRCNVIAKYILFLCANIRLHLYRYSMFWQMYAEYVKYCDVSVIL